VVEVMRVASFTLRRLVAGLFTLALLITLTFVIFWTIPGQPESFLYPSSQHLSSYEIHNADKLMGLDQSKPQLYVHYLWHTLTFRFGSTWSDETLVPINKLQPGPEIDRFIYRELHVTLSLILGGAVAVLLLAIPLGTIAGSRIGSWTDRTISIVALIGVCMHPMVLGLILSSLFGKHLRWAPEVGYCPLLRGPNDACGGPGDWAAHLAIPWLTFALLFLALYTRMVRASVADTLHEDFVRTARAKGASETRVLSRHVLPNATLRILTMIGMEIATAIGVCIYLESAFRLGGLAQGAVFAFGGNTQLDLPLMLATMTMLTLIVVVGNLVVDVLYAVLDPRAGRERPGRGAKSFSSGVI
jgi:peptide/nickel transport system permease protein